MSNFFNMNLYTKDVTVSTLKKIPQENKQVALQALNNIQEKYKNKEIDEYYRVDAIGKVLPLLNEKNLPMFNEIMNADIGYMKEKNIRRIASYYVEPLLNYNSEEDIEKFKITSQLKNKDNEYIFNDYCILDIIKNKDIKSQNLKTIAQSERMKMLSSYDIMAVASRTNEENKDVLPDLLEYKNIHNNYNFDYYDITAILDITKKENCQHIKNYLKNSDYTWLTGHLYSHYFRNIFASLNSNNTEILPIVMDEYKNAIKQERNIVTSDADITHLLVNITNDEAKVLKDCLNYKDGRSDEYYFERHSINALPELVHSLSDEKLAPITKNLLEQKVKGFNTFLRFSNIDGIKNLSQIIYENDKNKIDSLNYVLSLEENSEPRFSMVKNIVALTNLLSDEDKKQKTQEILDIKVPEGYRFDDFYSENLFNKITKDLDIEKVKKLAKVMPLQVPFQRKEPIEDRKVAISLGEDEYFVMGDNWTKKGSSDCCNPPNGGPAKCIYKENIEGVIFRLDGICTYAKVICNSCGLENDKDSKVCKCGSTSFTTTPTDDIVKEYPFEDGPIYLK